MKRFSDIGRVNAASGFARLAHTLRRYLFPAIFALCCTGNSLPAHGFPGGWVLWQVRDSKTGIQMPTVPTGSAFDKTNGFTYITGYQKLTGGSSGEDYCTIRITSAGVVDTTWGPRTYNEANQDDRATAIAIDDDNNVIVTGTITMDDGSKHIHTVKYSGGATGDVLWENTYNPTDPTHVSDLAVSIGTIKVDATHHYVYVTGTARITGSTNDDILILKYDNNGPLDNPPAKAVVYDRSGTLDAAAFIAVTADGVAVTGRTVNVTSNEFDMLTLKYDLNLTDATNKVWQHASRGGKPAGNNGSWGRFVKIDSDGNVIASGFDIFSATDTDIYTAKYCYNPDTVKCTTDTGTATAGSTTTITDSLKSWALQKHVNHYLKITSGPNDGQIRKIVSNTADTLTVESVFTPGLNGDETYKILTDQIWEARYSGSYADDVKDLTIDADYVYITGIASRISSDTDFYTAKYSGATGALVWEAMTDGGSTVDVSSAIVVDDGGEVYVTGYSKLSGVDAIQTMKYKKVTPTTSGRLLWKKTFKNPDNPDLLDIRSTGIGLSPGGVVAVGWANKLSTPAVESGTASTGTKSTLQDTTKSWLPDQFRSYYLKITAAGDNFDQVRMITNSTGQASTPKNTLTVSPAFPADITNVDSYEIYSVDTDYYALKYEKGILDRPTGLTATTTSNTEIHLAWESNSSGTEDGFELERCMGKNCFTSPVAKGTAKSTSDQVTLNDTGNTWTDNQYANYYLKITASTNSNMVGEVRLITGNTPHVLTVSTVFPTAVSSGDSYEIYRPITTITRNANVTSYDDTGLTPDTFYYYRVRAYKSPSEYSDYSDPARGLTVKLDYPLPDPLNTFVYDGTDHQEDTSPAVAAGPDNNPVITGYSYFNGGDGFDYYTIKLHKDKLSRAPAESILWAAQYDGGQYDNDQAMCLAVDKDNNVIVSGDSTLPPPPPGSNMNSLMTLKYKPTPDRDGYNNPTHSWFNQYNGPGKLDDHATAVATDAAGNFAVAGHGKRDAGNHQYIYVVKYNADNTKAWAADLNDAAFDAGVGGKPYAVAFGLDGNVYVAGQRHNGTDFDYFIIKLNGISGQKIWSDTYNSTRGDDFAKAMTVDSNGDVYVTGSAINTAGNRDFYTIKYDGRATTTTASRLWEGRGLTVDGSESGEATAIKIDPLNGDVLVSGTVLSAPGDHDFALLRFKADGTLVKKKILFRPDNDDTVIAMGLDNSGNTYVAGNTSVANGVASMAILFDADSSVIGSNIYGTGTAHEDKTTALAVNSIGEAFIAGTTRNASVDYLLYKLPVYPVQAPAPITVTPDFSTALLSWPPNSTATNVSYKGKRADGACSDSSEFGAEFPVATNSYNASGLEQNTPYCFAFKTISDSGDSRWVTKTVTTLNPSAPTLTVTPTNSTQIDLAWANTTTGQSGFEVWRCADTTATACTGFTRLTTPTTTATTYSDQTVCPGTIYRYQVRAIGTGWASAFSTILGAIPPTFDNIFGDPGIEAPNPMAAGQAVGWTYAGGSTVEPSDISFDAGVLHGGAQSLKVNAAATTTYEGIKQYVRFAPGGKYQLSAWFKTAAPAGKVACDTLDGSSFLIANSGTTSEWEQISQTLTVPSPSASSRVRCYVYQGYQGNIDDLQVKPLYDLTATAYSESQINLSWKDNYIDETGYKIYRCKDAGCTIPDDPAAAEPFRIATLDPNSTAYIDTGLEPKAWYRYRVTAFKTAPASCNGGWYVNSAITADTQATYTPPPLSKTLPNTTQVNLSWTDTTTAESAFVLQRCTGTGCTFDAGHDLQENKFTGAFGKDSTLSWNDMGVCTSTDYQYRIKAINEGIYKQSPSDCWKKSTPLTINNFKQDFLTRMTIPGNNATPTAYLGMKDDFSDIRIYDETAKKELPYWIEAKSDMNWATVWFKTGNNNTITLYYDNANATNTGNIANVFGSGVMGFWPFSEPAITNYNNGGSITNDMSGLGNNLGFSYNVRDTAGGVVNPTAYGAASALFGNAYGSNGTTYKYASKGSPNLPTGSVASVEAWVYPKSYPDATWNSIVTWGPQEDNDSLTLAIQNSGRPSFANHWSWGNTFIPTSGPQAVLNAWNHVAVVLNGTSVTFYMNGQPVTGTLGATPNFKSTGWLFIGMAWSGWPSFDGLIDDVRIYNRALTQADINSRYGTVLPSVTVGTASNNTTTCLNNSVIWGDDDTFFSTPLPVPVPAPTPPINLNVVADSEAKITLTWKNKTSDQTGFKIFRCVDNPGPGCTFPLEPTYTVPSTATFDSPVTYIDTTGLEPYKTYRYMVKAYKTGVTCPWDSAADTSPTKNYATTPLNMPSGIGKEHSITTDCNDLRFIYTDGNISLPYWIESGCNTSRTKVHVRVPTMAGNNGTKTLSLLYGNPAAPARSNGQTTFDFFDDFTGSTIDISKWSISGGDAVDSMSGSGFSVTNGFLHGTLNKSVLTSRSTFTTGKSIQTKAKTTTFVEYHGPKVLWFASVPDTYGTQNFGWKMDKNDALMFAGYGIGEKRSSSVTPPASSAITDNMIYTLSLVDNYRVDPATYDMDVLADYFLPTPSPFGTSFTTGAIFIGGNLGHPIDSYVTDWDWVRVRKSLSSVNANFTLLAGPTYASYSVPTAESGAASGGDIRTLQNSSKTWQINRWAEYYLKIVETVPANGANKGLTRRIVSNDGSSLNVSPDFPASVAVGDTYEIVEADSFGVSRALTATNSGSADANDWQVTIDGGSTTLDTTPLASDQIKLTWTNNTTSETGHIIERCLGTDTSQCPPYPAVWDSVGQPNKYKTININGLGTTTYTDRDIKLNTPYCYRVKANRTDTPTWTTDPTAPVCEPPHAQTPPVLDEPQNTASKIVLTWSDPIIGENNYVVERCIINGSDTDCTIDPIVGKLAPLGHNVRTYEDLQCAGKYKYRVKAVKYGKNGVELSTADNWPGYSYEKTGYIITPPAPSQANAVRASEMQINLSWQDNTADEQGFKIYRCKDAGSTACTNFVLHATVSAATGTKSGFANGTGTTVTYIDTKDLAAGSTYRYRVTAYVTGSCNRESDPGNEVYAITSVSAPTSTSGVAANTTGVYLNWADNTASDSYFTLERCNDAGCTNRNITASTQGNIKAFYSFENSLNDSSGNNLNLWKVNGYALVYEDGGLSMTTDTSFQSATTDILNTDNHAIEFDIKIRATNSNWKKIFGYTPSGTDRSPGIWLHDGNSATLHWRYDPGNSGVNALGVNGDGGTPFTLNKWYHIRGEKFGSNFKVYVNGAKVAETTVSNPKTTGNAALWFGGADVTIKNFRIDDNVKYVDTTACAGIAYTYRLKASETGFVSAPVAISNFQPNFQTRVTVPASIVAGRTVSQINDLRFYDSTNKADIPYWIETVNADGTATVWIKTGTSNTITLYANKNATAASYVSDGSKVFDLFDDFNGTTLNSAWTKSATGAATLSVGGGVVTLDNPGYGKASMTQNLGSTPLYVLETRVKVSSAYPNNNRIRGFARSAPGDSGFFSDAFPVQVFFSGTGGYTGKTIPTDQYIRSRLTHSDTTANSWDVFMEDGTAIFSATYTGTPTNIYYSVGDSDTAVQNGKINLDWVLLRKYASSEPSGKIEMGQVFPATLSNAGGGSWSVSTPVSIVDFQPYYPIKLTVNKADKMNNEFKDIRFYDVTAGVELPYWIESKTDGVSATVWLKTGATNTIAMNYGNSSATSSSNKIAVLGSGLVGYWPFEEAENTVSGQTADNSGYNLKGDITNGTTIVSGGFYGNGLSLDGTSNFVSVSDTTNSPLDITGNITIELWYKYDQATPSDSNLLGKTTGNGAPLYSIYTNTNRGLKFKVGDGVASPQIIDTGTSLTMVDGTWYHIVAKYDKTLSPAQMSLFVNGQRYANGSFASPLTIAASDRPLTFGAAEWTSTPSQTFGGFAKGIIDEVRIYNRPLSDAEISGHYSLVGYWPFEEAENTVSGQTADYSGNGLNGNLTSGATIVSGGKYGNGLRLNGTSNNVNVPDTGSPNSPLDITGSFSIELWYKFDSTSPTNSKLVSKQITPGLDGPGAQGNSYAIMFDDTAPANGRSLRLKIANNAAGSGSSAFCFSAATATPVYLADGNWYHVVGRYDATATKKLSLFINGIEASNNTSCTITSLSKDSLPLYIGSYNDSNTADFSKGVIDEVRIYNRPLNDAEIAGHYSANLNAGSVNTVQFPALSNPGTGTWSNGARLSISNFQPDFQTKVTLSSAQTAAMKPDLSDLRFYDTTAQKELPYWIEGTIPDMGSFHSSFTNGSGSWTLREPLTITNFQPNFLTRVVVPAASVAAMKSDLSDLRFYDYTANQELQHWIESISGTATVWLKTGLNNTIAMYYGNPGATYSAATNKNAVFGTGLVGYWPFKEAANTTTGSTADVSGSNLSGALNGFTANSGYGIVSDGKFGNALNLNGTNNYAAVADTSGSPLDITGSITIELWYNYISANPSWTRVLSKGVYPGEPYSLQFDSSGSKLYFLINTSNSTSTYVGSPVSAALTPGWHHIVGRYDADSSTKTLSVFVDGIEYGTAIPLKTLFTNDSSLGVGASSTGVVPTKGMIDEVRIYNRALTNPEIASRYAATLPSVTVGIPSVWVRTGANNNIAMYYGNNLASSSSDAAATFDFFDDFAGSSLDANKWSATSTGDATVSNGKLQVTKGAVYSNAPVVSSTQNRIFEFKGNWQSVANGVNGGLALADKSGTQSMNSDNNALAYFIDGDSAATTALYPYAADGNPTDPNVRYNFVAKDSPVPTNKALYNPFISLYQDTRKPETGLWTKPDGSNITDIYVSYSVSYPENFTVYNASGQAIYGPKSESTWQGWVHLTNPTPGIYTVLKTSWDNNPRWFGDVTQVNPLMTGFSPVKDGMVAIEFNKADKIEYVVKNADNSDLKRYPVFGTWNKAPYLWLGYFKGSNSTNETIDTMTVDWVRARKYAYPEPVVKVDVANVSQAPAPDMYQYLNNWDSPYSSAVTVTTPQIGNLVSNSDFESGADKWPMGNGASIDTSVSLSGARSIKLTSIMNKNSGGAYFYQTLPPMIPGGNYTLTGNVRANLLNGFVFCRLIVNDGWDNPATPGWPEYTLQYSDSAKNNQQWQSFSYPLTLKTGIDGSKLGVLCGFYRGDDGDALNGLTDTAYLDMIQVVPNTPITLTASTVSESQNNLSWTDNIADETGFNIWRCEDTPGHTPCTFGSDPKVTVGANVTTYMDANLQPNTTFRYEVKAYKTAAGSCNDGWDSNPSNVAFAKTSDPSPSVLTAKAITTTQVDLAWTDNTISESGFAIERSTDGGTNFSPLTLLLPDSKTYSDATACPSTTYTYRLRALKTGLSLDNSFSCSWNKRVHLTFSGFQPQYQTAMNVTNVAGMKSDFSDLRFFDSTANKELPYWIESKTDGVGGTAKIWLKTGDNNNIDMFYGYSNATAASSVDKTFEFYEDFSGTSIDTGKWSIVDYEGKVIAVAKSGFSVSGGYLHATNTTGALKSIVTFPAGSVLETKAKTTTWADNETYIASFDYAPKKIGWMAYSKKNIFPSRLISYFDKWDEVCDDYKGHCLRYSVTDYTSMAALMSSHNLMWRVSVHDPSKFSLKILDLDEPAKTHLTTEGIWWPNETTIDPAFSDTRSFILGGAVDTPGGAYAMDYDWVRVRKYAYTEPTVVLGSEISTGSCFNFTNQWGNDPDPANNYYSNNSNQVITAAAFPPSNVTVTEVIPNKANISWLDNTSEETGFEIWDCIDSDFNKCTAAAVPANTTTYTVSANVWSKRAPVSISDFRQNFPTRLTITVSDLVGTKSDLSDIRFFDTATPSTMTELPYWIEGISGGTATIWVKTGANNSIYLYYGNPNAASASNGSAVFEFFDNFATLDVSVPTSNGNDSASHKWSKSISRSTATPKIGVATCASSSCTQTNLVDTAKSWNPGSYDPVNSPSYLLILSVADQSRGANVGISRKISAHTATSITVDTAFPVAIAVGDTYQVLNNPAVATNIATASITGSDTLSLSSGALYTNAPVIDSSPIGHIFEMKNNWVNNTSGGGFSVSNVQFCTQGNGTSYTESYYPHADVRFGGSGLWATIANGVQRDWIPFGDYLVQGAGNPLPNSPANISNIDAIVGIEFRDIKNVYFSSKNPQDYSVLYEKLAPNAGLVDVWSPTYPYSTAVKPYIFLGHVWGANGSINSVTPLTVDWVRVRPYAATEPLGTITAASAETVSHCYSVLAVKAGASASCTVPNRWPTANSTPVVCINSISDTIHLDAVAKGPFSIQLDWTKETNVEIEKKLANTIFAKINTVTGSTYIDKVGIEPQKQYTYRVRKTGSTDLLLFSDDFSNGINTSDWTPEVGHTWRNADNSVFMSGNVLESTNANGTAKLSATSGAVEFYSVSPGDASILNYEMVSLNNTGLVQGDFDVQMDYTLPNGLIASSLSNPNYYVILGYDFDAPAGYRYKFLLSRSRIEDPSDNVMKEGYAAKVIDPIAGTDVTIVIPSNETAGKLRITKTGNNNGTSTVSLYTYSSGGPWVLRKEVLVKGNPLASPWLSIMQQMRGAETAGTSMKATVDNVKISAPNTNTNPYSNEETVTFEYPSGKGYPANLEGTTISTTPVFIPEDGVCRP